MRELDRVFNFQGTHKRNASELARKDLSLRERENEGGEEEVSDGMGGPFYFCFLQFISLPQFCLFIN